MPNGSWYESGFFWIFLSYWQGKLSKISRDSKMVHEELYICWHGMNQKVNNEEGVETGHFILGGGRSYKRGRLTHDFN